MMNPKRDEGDYSYTKKATDPFYMPKNLGFLPLNYQAKSTPIIANPISRIKTPSAYPTKSKDKTTHPLPKSSPNTKTTNPSSPKKPHASSSLDNLAEVVKIARIVKVEVISEDEKPSSKEATMEVEKL